MNRHSSEYTFKQCGILNYFSSFPPRIDQNSLQFYAKLCGYTGEIHIIPPCYLENYFVTLVTVLITSDQFLLSPLGKTLHILGKRLNNSTLTASNTTAAFSH